MSLGTYREVMRLPLVSRLVLFITLSRMPAVASGIVLTLHVVNTLKMSYAAAGVIAMLVTFGQALSATWRGRMLDRLGLRRVVWPSIIVLALVWFSAAHVSYPLLAVLSLWAGLMALPLFTVSRQSLSVLVPQQLRRPAFMLDSIAVEVSFMLAPLIGVYLAVSISTTVAINTIAVTMLLAGIALYWFNPPLTLEDVPTDLRPADQISAIETHDAPRDPVVFSQDRYGWMHRSVLLTLVVTFAAGLVLQGTELSIVALLQEMKEEQLTGVILLIWAAASLIGGVVYGVMRKTPTLLTMLFWIAITMIPIGLVTEWWWLALAVIPTGAICAPILSGSSEYLSHLVVGDRRGEAMGWHGSALTVGVGLGGPLSGMAIDFGGAVAGFAVIGGIGLLLWLAVLSAKVVFVRFWLRPASAT